MVNSVIPLIEKIGYRSTPTLSRACSGIMAGDIGTTAMGALVVNFVLQMKGEDGGRDSSVPAHHLRQAVLGCENDVWFWVQFLLTHEVSDHFSPPLLEKVP